MDETQNDLEKFKNDLAKYVLTPRSLRIALENQMRKMEPAMVWGRMGIGKSDIVRQIGHKHGCRVVAIHLPQFDPTDLKGIPVRVGEHVRWVTTSFLPQQCERHLYSTDDDPIIVKFDFPYAKDVAVYIVDGDDTVIASHNTAFAAPIRNDAFQFEIQNPRKCVAVYTKKGTRIDGLRAIVAEKAILFLDELSAAVGSVQNAALQLINDRLINEYVVPMGVPMVAAGNRQSDKAYIHQMSAPLANRLAHYRLEVSVEEWVDDFAIPHAIRPEIISFIKWKGRDRLVLFNPIWLKEGDMGFCTPRMWTKLSKVWDDSLPILIRNATIAAHIGSAVANEFIHYINVISNLPDVEKILDGEITEIDDLDLGQKWGMATALCVALKRRYDHYYISNKDLASQPANWTDATQNFCRMVEPMLGRELAVFALKTISVGMKIEPRALKGPAYSEMSSELISVMTKSF